MKLPSSTKALTMFFGDLLDRRSRDFEVFTFLAVLELVRQECRSAARKYSDPLLSNPAAKEDQTMGPKG